MKQILFVELLGGIGDLVMALPSIHGLARSHPKAEVNVFAFRPGIELLKEDRYIARILPATRHDRSDGTPVAREELAEVLARKPFDLIVCDVNYGGIDTLIENSGAPNKVTRLWHHATENERIDQVFLRNLINNGYIDSECVSNDGPHLALSENDRRWARKWQMANEVGGKQVAMFNPDTGMAIKRWGSEHFVALGRGLLKREDTVLYIITGEAKSAAEEIAADIGYRARILPKLPLPRFAGVAALASLFVSVDTGPAKIAAAVGTPTVGLFGPTWAGRYGLPAPHVNVQSPFRCPDFRPMNMTLQPCWYSGHCPANSDRRSCTDHIDPHLVLKKAFELLDSTTP